MRHDNLLAEVAAGNAERLRLHELREKGLLRD
jgi:hypothetical protein